jgi:serine/threonine protein kinase
MFDGSAAAPASVSVSVPASVCATCGQSLATSAEPTRELGQAPDAARQEARGKHFLPGTILAKRYRIVSQLGSGGAGEVYRADDLTLDQPVALKFYPGRLQGEADTLSRFRREVRLARQIAHPNICRVFDISETEGRAFITMEFVRGEDLHSLLRRIGRLPADKALQVALQLCSGLTAAHASGVLHRDLKPANVMLDDRGNVRVTDFGLAALAGEFSHELAFGTPGYMAPEQLAGKEVTALSDLYALGLVLHEIFTGKRAIELQTAADLVRPDHALLRAQEMTGVDARVRHAILLCLEPDPAHRPPSALHVAAALSRTGPPAAAEAEMMKPEPVPPVSPEEHPHNRLGWSLVMATMFGFALLLLLAPGSTGLGFVFNQKSPNDSLGTAFTWLWCIALQSFLVLLSIAYVLRSGSTLSSRTSPEPHDTRGNR